MQFLAKIKRKVRQGVSLTIGKFAFIFKVEMKRDLAQERILEMSYARYLENRFPVLRDQFGFVLKPENVSAVLKFYIEYIPMFHSASQGAHLRSLLQRLKNQISNQDHPDSNLLNAVTNAIAYSDLKDGLPDRAKCLRNNPKYRQLWDSETKAIERAYGAEYISLEWPDADRGLAIQHYLEAHLELLKGKRVMHFAPEASLRKWFQANQSTLNLATYHTVDGMLDDVNDRFDIVDIQLPSESFDVIICHRVLEHIPDDLKALKELNRLLKPGGVMNFSVPQMPHRTETAEWIVPDDSHHWHVRQYGADLEQRLATAGFRVELEPWLLKQPREKLLALHAYPLRMYNCWKKI